MARKRTLIDDLISTYRLNGLGLKRGDEKKVFEVVDEQVALVDTFFSRLEKIKYDGRLTEDGKVDAKRDAGRKTLATVSNSFQPVFQGLEKNEEHLRGELRAAVVPRQSNDPADRMEAALLRAEVRRIAQGMNELELELLYRLGDHNIRKALEELPQISVKNHAVRVESFVSAELREEILLESARKALPETAELLDDVILIREVHRAVKNAVTKEVEKAAPGAVEPAAPRIVA